MRRCGPAVAVHVQPRSHFGHVLAAGAGEAGAMKADRQARRRAGILRDYGVEGLRQFDAFMCWFPAEPRPARAELRFWFAIGTGVGAMVGGLVTLAVLA
jgi:hypothetical protein